MILDNFGDVIFLYTIANTHFQLIDAIELQRFTDDLTRKNSCYDFFELPDNHCYKLKDSSESKTLQVTNKTGQED